LAGALLGPEGRCKLPRRGQKYDVIFTQRQITSVLEVVDTVKDKSDSIRFLMLRQSWIPGGNSPPVPPGYAYGYTHAREATPYLRPPSGGEGNDK